MPRYRFTGDARVTLPFRNGRCDLTFANLDGEDGWAWVARKQAQPGQHIVLVRCGNVTGLHAALSVDGVAVPPDSAAEKVMRAAVKCGFAEELAENAPARPR